MIEISAHRDMSEVQTFHSTYAILDGSLRVLNGTVAGAFKSIEDAEAEAIRAARRWVDEQVH